MKRLLSVVVSLLASVVSAAVTLDAPVVGKNYQSMTVSGAADTATVMVKLIDRTASSVPVSQSVTVSGGRFSATFNSLSAGHEYAVCVDDEERTAVVTARELTSGWVHENAATYLGEEVGTGVWGGDGEVEVVGSRIVIAAEAGEGTKEHVVFSPTNYFGKARGYRVRANTTFEGEAQTPDSTDGIFGVILVIDPQDVNRAVFYIIDGQSWKRTDHVGVIATVYEWEFFVDEENRRVSYYLISSGKREYVGSGVIPDDVSTRFSSVDFQGYGSVAAIDGEAYDTKLVGAEFHFDGYEDGSLTAGKNFTNIYLKGWVAVTNLWDTDTASGTIEVRIVSPDGVSHVVQTVDWSGFGGIYGITNLVEGLTRGENYTIEVYVKDSEGGTGSIAGEGIWSSHGVTGRRTDDWYLENAATVGGREPPSGEWDVGEGISVVALDGDIVQIASDGTVTGAKAVFVPTNEVPRNGVVCVNTFDLFMDSAVEADTLPDASGELFGVSFVETAAGPALAVVINGAWTAVDRSVFAPAFGVLYRLDIITGSTSGESVIEYYVSTVANDMKLVKRGAYRNGSKPYPSEIAFSGDGRFKSAVGEFFDTTLFVIDFDPLSQPGTNFVANSVSGTITVTPVWDTDCSNGVIRVTIRNGRGEIAAVKEVEFHGSASIDISVDGLEPGESYTADVEIIKTDGPADGDVDFDDVLVPTAKKYDGRWIDENASTFAGEEPGTGDWIYRKSPLVEAKVVVSPQAGRVIQIASELTSSVTFSSTSEAPEVLNSTVRKLTFDICSEVPGFYLAAPEYAKSRPADLAGVTIACDDLNGDALHFAVYNPENGGSWTVLTNTTAELNRVYSLSVVITYPNPNKTTPSSISYWLEKPRGQSEQIAFFEPANGIPEVTDNYRTRLRFAGSGLVRSIVGDCYDAHLASIGGVEYWTIADAVHEIGSSGRVLTPLWYSTYTADVNSGWFGVNDPYHWLSIFWPLGYVVEITDRGEVRFYLFHLSDYWIDWAVKEDAVETPAGWEIKSANGLAWLAAESTNRWLTGEITLAQDITNLYEHIWTPISGFTGTFDGNSRKLVGLTNKGVDVCRTNSLDMSVFGLFGTASNSVFRSVAFEDVAITNSADAVASLLGCSLGGLSLTNVVVRSGSIAGGGRFVSGIVGYVGDFSDVSVFKNLNAASVALIDPQSGSSASGIANLGLDAGLPGGVSVVSNENRGALATTVVSEIGGGNVAQIVAGTEPDALFDPEAVTVTGNIGTGDVSRVESLNHSAWPIAKFPVVNLSAEVSRQSNDEDYKEFLEANDSTDVLIDPWRFTARMIGAFYQNGATNFTGRINDQITASKPGDVVTLQESCEVWSPVVLDRPIVLELDNKVLDNVFDGYTFQVAEDAGGALVRNGTVTYPANPTAKLATRPVGDQWYTNNVNAIGWNENYWERGILIDDEFVSGLAAMSLALHPTAIVSADAELAFTVNAADNSIDYHGQKALSLAPLGCKLVDNGDGSYIVDIDDDPATAPEINLDLAPNGGTSTVTVRGAKANCQYCLQSVSSLAESWDKAEDRWVTVENDGDELVFEVDTSGSSRFYRIKVQKK